MIAKLEGYLYTKGFTDATLRLVMRNLCIYALVCLAIIICALPVTILSATFGLQVAAIGLGGILFSSNFWALSLFIIHFLPGGYSSALIQRHLVRFVLRLVLIIAVFTIAVILGASPLALALGFSMGLPITAITALYKLR